jgi:hypothetical protein
MDLFLKACHLYDIIAWKPKSRKTIFSNPICLLNCNCVAIVAEHYFGTFHRDFLIIRGVTGVPLDLVDKTPEARALTHREFIRRFLFPQPKGSPYQQ